MRTIGRNRNTTDTASIVSKITINSSTATTIAAANPNRIFFEVFAPPVGVSNNHDYCAFLRPYPAAQDNVAHGAWIGSYQVGNDSLFKGEWRMPSDNIYTGEFSAILCTGQSDINIYIVEY
jgi:hypothetical protein